MSQDFSPLSTYLKEHLPITEHMQVTVLSYDGQTLRLSAPLAPNINDKKTAFGGSLYNVAVLACWGMLYLKLQEHELDCDQVIAKADISYMAPVKGSLIAECHAPTPEALDDFVECFKQRGKAKLSLSSHVLGDSQDRPAVEFNGLYAIVKK